MKKIFNQKQIVEEEHKFQEIIFLLGIFIFFTVIIIVLFPGEDTEVIIGKDFLIFVLNTVPIVASIYFIIISFRRKIYSKPVEFNSSIRNKMALAFLFVAVVPSLFLLFVSSNFINKTFSKLISVKTSKTFQESIIISRDLLHSVKDDIYNELKFIQNIRNENKNYIPNRYYLKKIIETQKNKNLKAELFTYNKGNIYNIYHNNDKIFLILKKFYSTKKNNKKIMIDRLNIFGIEFISGALRIDNSFIILYRIIPKKLIDQIKLFTDSYQEYEKHELLKERYKSGSGIFLLILAFIIIGISVLVSLYLSKNITRPVLRLTKAAQELAHGNFDVEMKRTSDDELGILFGAFNMMVSELKSSKELQFQKQRLEAWRDMARMLVHEIKNPLTPIRLSAERMRRRYIENHKNIEEIILSGTKTIAEEVEVLMNILESFTKFARLPEMKPEKSDINDLLQSSAEFHYGHENITFKLNLSDKLSPLNIDKILIRQVIINIIKNSIDAISGKGEIEIITEEIYDGFKNFIRIKISDNGKGINPNELDKIFDPGYSKKKGGTGLGLAIVEKIIIEHSGRIFCDSIVGKSTTFTICLPVDLTEGV